MSLRLKIISGFLILAVMLFAAGALSIYELTHIGQSVQSLLDENYRSINAAKNMIEALEREDSGILLITSGEKKGASIIEVADRDFQKAFEIAENNITIPGEDKFVLTITNSYVVFKDLWQQIISDPQKVDLQWYFNKVHPAFAETKDKVNQLMSLNDQALYTTASALKSRARRSIMPGVVAIIASLIFTAIFNFFINSLLSKIN